jgi:hypothetical protein
MKPQEGCRRVARAARDFARVRSLGNTEQQADDQITPE